MNLNGVIRLGDGGNNGWLYKILIWRNNIDFYFEVQDWLIVAPKYFSDGGIQCKTTGERIFWVMCGPLILLVKINSYYISTNLFISLCYINL